MRAPVDDIRDIRAPLAILDGWRWPLAIAAILALVVAAVLLVRWVRKRRLRPLTPREKALLSLEAAEKLAREGRSREWAELVAEAVRSALSARVGSDVLPQTTTELAHALRATSLAEAPLVLELLEICDLARFARASLDEEALLAQTASARDVVLRLFDMHLPSPAPAPREATVAP